jgi:hypothetical protein
MARKARSHVGVFANRGTYRGGTKKTELLWERLQPRIAAPKTAFAPEGASMDASRFGKRYWHFGMGGLSFPRFFV